MNKITPEIVSSYRDDGVVLLPAILEQSTLDALEQCFEWSLANPTPSANGFYTDAGSTFYQDLCNPRAAAVYREILCDSPMADIVATLWGARDVWFLYEQVFVKEGGDVRRTPWHQDTPYLALDGEAVAVMWINFAPVAKSESLEFVRGSHRSTLYDGSAFDPEDDTMPVFGHGLPRLPDIESARGEYDIVSYAVAPGDVVVFHPSTLHGGAPASAGSRRRTLSLRFFGEDAVYVERPEQAPAPLVDGLHESLRYGDPFRHPAFPRLRPTPGGFDDVPQSYGGHAISLQTQMQGE